jgi:transaldolase
MKFFLDTANVEAIKQAVEWGVCDGVTTNPTLLSKEKGEFEEIIKEICSAVNGPVSVEAVGRTREEMVKEAKTYSSWAKNIVIKIPMTKEGLKAVSRLKKEGIKTNVTLVFSANQALLAAKAGAAYVSPFIGRLDDIGHCGMDVVRETVSIFRTHNIKTEVIVASIRHPLHVAEAAQTGAEIATIPFDVLEKMLKHPLTDAGIKKFLEDWEKVRK